MKIEIDEQNVMTLEQAAKELASAYRWDRHKANPDSIEFWAESDSGEVHGLIDLGGWATDAETGDDLDEWNVNWCDDLDFPDVVWAKDRNGNAVLLHN